MMASAREPLRPTQPRSLKHRLPDLPEPPAKKQSNIPQPRRRQILTKDTKIPPKEAPKAKCKQDARVSSLSRSPNTIDDRVDSLTGHLQAMRIVSGSSAGTVVRPESPSKLPVAVTPVRTPAPSPTREPRSRQRFPPKIQPHLTRNTNILAWDEQFQNIERMMQSGLQNFTQTAEKSVSIRDALHTISEERNQLQTDNVRLTSQVSGLEHQLQSATVAHEYEVEKLTTRYEFETRDLTSKYEDEKSEATRLVLRVQEQDRLGTEVLGNLQVQLSDTQTQLRDMRFQNDQASAKVTTLSTANEQLHVANHDLAAKLERESAKVDKESARVDKESVKVLLLEQEKSSLQEKVIYLESGNQQKSDQYVTMEIRMNKALEEVQSAKARLELDKRSLQDKVMYLESGNQQQSDQYAAMEVRMNKALEDAQHAKARLEKEETLRKKLHNQVQELKGNIRVFARVRAITEFDGNPFAEATISYPDQGEDKTQMEIRGKESKNSLGKCSTKTYNYTFDRVFEPQANNPEVFAEVADLVQSALDGYNVCLFAYGQTGSGKTYTMSSKDGVIPLALRMIYDSTEELAERGWVFHMHGSFVEVYNEGLNDLLGRQSDLDKKKLEIKHNTDTLRTMITNITSTELSSYQQVETVVENALGNRSVAKTRANERSSRSHSVFMLTLHGENNITSESCRGTLNLVDLAGSERLKSSGAEGKHLKETQAINSSLSTLSKVIHALAEGAKHIPYKESTLTNLLKYSLSGNSKTLMFCMLSPLAEHLKETLSSLQFAEMVNSTHIGKARKA